MLNFDWEAAKRVFYGLTPTQTVWLNKMIKRERKILEQKSKSHIRRRRYL